MSQDKMEYNLLQITIDACRRKNLSCYGHHRSTSPNIDQIGTEGTIYTKPVATAGNTWDSSTAFFTGKLPHQVRVNPDGTGISEEEVFFTDILSRRGFKTGAAIGISFLDYDVFFRGRIDDYYSTHHPSDEGMNVREFHRRHRDEPRPIKWAKLAPKILLSRHVHKNLRNAVHFKTKSLRTQDNGGFELTEQAVNFIRENEYPWCFCLHYADAHMRQFGETPYTVPDEFLYEFFDGDYGIIDTLPKTGQEVYYTPEQMEAHQQLYDGALRFVDDRIGVVLDALKETGQYDDTIVVVVADHGDMLGEHGLIGHGHLWEEVLGVPMIVKHPHWSQETVTSRIPTRDVINKIVRETPDSPPTQDRGYVISEDLSTGREWTEWRSGDRKVAVYDADWKLRRGLESVELYDLSRDPDETDDLKDEYPDKSAELLETYDEIAEEGEVPSMPSFDQGVEERLEDLGYL